MILDSLANARHFQGFNRRIAMALEFLRDPKTVGLEPPAIGTENSLRLSIDGDEVFALIQRYQTKPASEGFWEAHRKYIDVQCVMEGVEMMGCADLSVMRVVQEYDAKRDFVKLALGERDEASNFVRVRQGMFAIFMPHDAHMPGVAVDGVWAMVKKIVVKVRVE